MRFFADYSWKMGVPVGVGGEEPAIRIITNPYHKRYSVEKYQSKQWAATLYDSILLDFRHLTPMHQTAWQKEIIEDAGERTLVLIRNQDDRVVYLEESYFERDVCRQSRVLSPRGELLCTHQLYYTALNDPFNGVILVDRSNHPVMVKRYETDTEGTSFTELLSEEWDMGGDTSPSLVIAKIQASLL